MGAGLGHLLTGARKLQQDTGGRSAACVLQAAGPATAAPPRADPPRLPQGARGRGCSPPELARPPFPGGGVSWGRAARGPRALLDGPGLAVPLASCPSPDTRHVLPQGTRSARRGAWGTKTRPLQGGAPLPPAARLGPALGHLRAQRPHPGHVTNATRGSRRTSYKASSRFLNPRVISGLLWGRETTGPGEAEGGEGARGPALARVWQGGCGRAAEGSGPAPDPA